MAQPEAPTLSVMMLGAGQEVGRSCCVLKYRGKTVVCDCGIHPAHDGLASLPFIDELDWSTVDAILITHFHLDHAAALTYVTERTNFRDGPGKVYMTHPTKAVYKYMMQDFVKMSHDEDVLFTPMELAMSLNTIIPISTHQQINPCPGLSFTPYHAGHVLGACMYLIDIAGLKILYTGDYSREEDRHLVKAEIPPVRPDVLIIESTFGVQTLEKREDLEARFTSMVHDIVRRGGHVLLPTFALGRAQELLLILDEYWSRHPDLKKVPIFYASTLAQKCMTVYQTYIHTMNANIRGRFAKRDNPFVFKHISPMPKSKNWEKRIAEGPPCVVLASPGFMQSGTSRMFLEMWAPDPRNGCIVTGYSVEGTLARDIISEPEEIPSMSGGTIPRRLSVEGISFSAHVDFSQNSEFIEAVKARHIILVHGEQNAMGRLRAAMQSRYKERKEDVKIYTPRNLEELQITFRGERVAKAIGQLASKPLTANAPLSGLLVAKDFSYTLLDPRDLRDFTGLNTSSVLQRMNIYLGVGLELVKWHLEGMYGRVEEGRDEEGRRILRVMGAVDVKHTGAEELTLEWSSSASSDMIADSVMAVIVGIDKSPASVKLTTSSHSHSHDHSEPHHHDLDLHPHTDLDALDQASSDPTAAIHSNALRTEKIAKFLEAHFGDVDVTETREVEAGEDTDDAPGDTVMQDGGDGTNGDNETMEEDTTGESPAQKEATKAEPGDDAAKDGKMIIFDPAIVVKLDEWEARIGLLDLVVRCDYEPLRQRVESVLELAMTTVDSLSKLFVSPPRAENDPFTLLDGSAEKQSPLVIADAPAPATDIEVDVDVKDDESKTMSSGHSESIAGDVVKIEEDQ